ncbi:hypothetical protein KIW84_032790 [Lathyrus oleraceus]|uniref:Uncharacterized protein n=1 Tax=Pisum sativum TaxID=3888 RepID=A0A9D5B2C5_PEA|nr:hypothetical protein KIW84_032790 [Pisum sativum]
MPSAPVGNLVSGDQLLENGASGNSSIGTFLGWAMTFLYLSGRMPQIWLNIRRGHAEVRGSNYKAAIRYKFWPESFDVSLCFNWECHLRCKHTCEQLELVNNQTKSTMAGRCRRLCPS